MQGEQTPWGGVISVCGASNTCPEGQVAVRGDNVYVELSTTDETAGSTLMKLEEVPQLPELLQKLPEKLEKLPPELKEKYARVLEELKGLKKRLERSEEASTTSN